MTVNENFQVKIEEEEILRLLGYRDSEPEKEILNLIREEIKYCLGFIRPKAIWEKINISHIEENKVVLENGVILEGNFISGKLSNCQYVVMSVITIGEEIDRIIRQSFENDDFLKGMVADHIANSALLHVSESFRNMLVNDIRHSSFGITSKLSPGDTALDIQEQKKIFECLFDNETIGVTLTKSNMMSPIKSTSAIYGFGKGIGIARTELICNECYQKHCAYRKQERFTLNVQTDVQVTNLTVYKGSNLLQVLRKNNISVETPCGGKSNCGKCGVVITKGTPIPTPQDKKHFSQEEINLGVRLACSVTIESDMDVLVKSKIGQMQILTQGEEIDISIEPTVTKKYLKLTKPTLEDQCPDVERIARGLGMDKLIVDFDLLPFIGSSLREADFSVTASLYENILLQLEKGDTQNSCFGVAVDIGTTTIACYLLDLKTGRTIDTHAEVNKQSMYGADVISRIGFTIEDERGTKILQDIAVKQINFIIGVLCTKNGIKNSNIYNISIAGNTTMLHFLLGLPGRNISAAPFIPTLTSSGDYRARELGININGFVSTLPAISSYVGSDIVAGLLACGMKNSSRYSLLLDIGTNGEIALGNSERILCCATAAGPAFEGANIKCGIGGISGAINTINLSKEKIYTTIGDIVPRGICGSAVLDMVSELLKYELIDETGRMADEDEFSKTSLNGRMIYNGNQKSIIIEEHSFVDHVVEFTQKDVREVQLAKAAVASGIQILIKEAGIGYKDIEKVFISGGFGSYMNIESALNIGLLPKEFEGKISSIGSSAGVGAKLYLLSKQYRQKASEIAKMAEYIELSGRKDFQDYYMSYMMF